MVKGSAVLLADDTGMTLEWDNREAVEYQGMKERVVHFRMEGQFNGEPAVFMVNNVSRKGTSHADLGISLMARLGE
jgi:hypothetical protein